MKEYNTIRERTSDLYADAKRVVIENQKGSERWWNSDRRYGEILASLATVDSADDFESLVLEVESQAERRAVERLIVEIQGIKSSYEDSMSDLSEAKKDALDYILTYTSLNISNKKVPPLKP